VRMVMVVIEDREWEKTVRTKMSDARLSFPSFAFFASFA
jgi:hypothetical protein